MPTNNRLQGLINALNLNPRSFAIELGYEQATTIYNIIKRQSNPSRSTLDKICNRFPQVNREWLLTGQGSMFNTSTASSDDLTVTAKQVLDRLEPMLKNDFKKIAKEIEEIHEKITSIEFLEALKLIKAKKKEKNGNGKTNGVH
tara:strand:+ start:46 stop:477 length:432 start_codon:yes stop_codon:yes gene_type:complete